MRPARNTLLVVIIALVAVLGACSDDNPDAKATCESTVADLSAFAPRQQKELSAQPAPPPERIQELADEGTRLQSAAEKACGGQAEVAAEITRQTADAGSDPG